MSGGGTYGLILTNDYDKEGFKLLLQEADAVLYGEGFCVGLGQSGKNP